MFKKTLSAMTLVEILVAAFLISVVLVGLVSLAVFGKKYSLHGRYRMTAGEIGRNYLEPLPMGVRQDNWGNTCVSQDGANNPQACVDAGLTATWTDSQGIVYTPTYDISAAPAANLRKVRLRLSWQERE
jgi:Tfp pilus assembly protein PilV